MDIHMKQYCTKILSEASGSYIEEGLQFLVDNVILDIHH